VTDKSTQAKHDDDQSQRKHMYDDDVQTAAVL
jgi:hypothetical protein